MIGAGVSGLSAAYKLKLHGLNVTVFEADERTGGKLRSISRDGLLWDQGANTMTESEPAVGLFLDKLGLRDKQQYPLSQHKRYIAKNGVPVLLPSNPISLARSNFLAAGAKLHILLEPFLWKKGNSMKGAEEEESVGAFFERHFGKEVVDYLIDPFVAGTNGGDPESLSMRHVFPELWNLDKRFGSIISGAIQTKLSAKKAATGRIQDNSANKKPRSASFSFQGGMQTLTNALCNEFGKDELKLQSKVLELSCASSDLSQLDYWSVSYKSDEGKLSCQEAFDALIVTAPLSDAKQMKITRRGSPFSLDFLPEVSYLPMSVVITTFKRDSVKRPLEGFGVLVPSKEQQNGLKTLGTLFSSMMFPDRAPNDVYLYTTFVGGSRNRELARASTDELKQVVSADLRKLLGAEGEPAFVNHYCWSKAFPLYGRNYNSVIEAIDKMEKELPGLFYAGKSYRNVSLLSFSICCYVSATLVFLYFLV